MLRVLGVGFSAVVFCVFCLSEGPLGGHPPWHAPPAGCVVVVQTWVFLPAVVIVPNVPDTSQLVGIWEWHQLVFGISCAAIIAQGAWNLSRTAAAVYQTLSQTSSALELADLLPLDSAPWSDTLIGGAGVELAAVVPPKQEVAPEQP